MDIDLKTVLYKSQFTKYLTNVSFRILFRVLPVTFRCLLTEGKKPQLWIKTGSASSKFTYQY